MNLDLYAKRINYSKDINHNRQIDNKRKTLKDAIKSSFFKATVINLFKDKTFEALIEESDKNNNNKLLSCFQEEGEVKVGTVIRWKETDTTWMITDRNLNEISYFEGILEKCHDCQIETIKGKMRTWGVITMNPTWTDKMFDKTAIRTDNSTIELKIPYSDEIAQSFETGSLFTLKNTTWSVVSFDNISDDDIITIVGLKHANDVNNYLENKENPQVSVNDNTYIDGANEIYPLDENIYRITNPDIEGSWSVPNNEFITKTINNENELILIWNNTRKRENFTISYGEYTKEIKVMSLV